MITYHVDHQDIATLTLAHEEKRNAINEEMAGQVLDRLEQAEESGVRVLILRAKPSAEIWCAGHDLAELDVENLHAENPTLKIAKKLQAVSYPVLALVEGSVHGGGLILLLSADLVVAAENAEIAITSNRLGIPLTPDLHAFWLSVMGLHKAKELLFTATAISAHDAHLAGLYNHVVTFAELEPLTLRIAQAILQCSRKAIANTKHQLNLLARQTGLGAEAQARIDQQSREILRSQSTRERISKLLTSLRRTGE